MMTVHLLRMAGLVVAAAWVLFWTFFAAGEALSARGGFSPVPVLFVAALIGSLLTAWRLPMAGGILLLVEGLLVCAAYPIGFLRARSISTMAVVLLALAAPAIISGSLLVGSRMSSPRASAHR
jgi:hypothetical protein